MSCEQGTTTPPFPSRWCEHHTSMSSLPPCRRPSVTFNIAGHRVGAVIGRGGSVVSGIRARTGASISLQQQPGDRRSAFCPVVISARTADAVEAARDEVLAIAGGE